MKKLISLITASFMTMSIFTNMAFANDSSLEITGFNHDNITGIVKLSGFVNHKRGELPIVLTVQKDGKTVWAENGKTASVTDSNSFTFDTFRFIDKMSAGTYTFTVYARYADVSASVDIGYIPNSTWYNIVKTVNNNKEASAIEKNAAHITENVLYTEMNVDTYKALSDDAKNLISEFSMKKAYTIPETWEDTAENMQILSAAIAEFKESCANGMIFAELHDSYKKDDTASSKIAFDAWFDLYNTALDLESDNSETETIDENDFLKNVFPSNYDKPSFYSKLPGIAAKLDKTTIQKGVVDAVILSKVKETSNGNALGSFLEEYADYIGIDFGNATANEKGVAYTNIAQNDYASLSELAEAVEEEIADAGDNNSGGGGNGGGSSSSGGGGKKNNNGINSGSVSIGSQTGIITGTVNSGEEKGVSSDEAPFEDMENHIWAKDAVDFLYRRSIISGRNEKTYDPAGNVTRAEFIKMLVSTYNFEASDVSEISFKDVSAKDWFYDYVKKAAQKGIITGDENGYFNPDTGITREDMAVMVYRASKFADATEVVAFIDGADISGYAVPAVTSLYEKGVVAGVGDMVFAPKKNVTRAEAAQILYNVLIETVK